MNRDASTTSVVLPAPLHHACGAVAWTMLHPLRRPPLITPRAVGLPYQRFKLPSRGVSLAAWHVPAPVGAPPAGGIVLCHGHNDSRWQFVSMLKPLHQAGFELLLFDFPTMGVSANGVCTYGQGEKWDVVAALDWMRRERGVERLGLYGVSMGGATALLAAAEDPAVQAVVTDCAFARLDELVERRFLALPPRLRTPVAASVRHWSERWAGVSVADVSPEDAVAGWRPRPLLVIHAERDVLVPLPHAERLARAAGEQSELWVVPRVGHVGCRRGARQEYPQRISGFFRKHLAV